MTSVVRPFEGHYQNVETYLAHLDKSGLPQQIESNVHSWLKINHHKKYQEAKPKPIVGKILRQKITIKQGKRPNYDFGVDDFDLDLSIENYKVDREVDKSIDRVMEKPKKSKPIDLKLVQSLYSKLRKVKSLNLSYFDILTTKYKHGLKLSTWPNAQRTITSWVLPWTKQTRLKFSHMLENYTNNNSLVSIYLNRINQMKEQIQSSIRGTSDIRGLNSVLSEAILTSGSIAFHGSIGVSLLETGKICNVDHLFHFTALYMLTDSWLDDTELDSSSKLQVAKQLCELIEDPKPVDDHPLLSVMTERLMILIKEVPTSYQYLKNAFYAEMVSALIQTKDDLSLDTYLKVCEYKGATMFHCMQIICGSTPDQSGYIVGAIIQLVDDMHDIDEDIQDGIHTVATHILSKYGNLDVLLFYTYDLMEKLAPKHTMFKPFIMALTMHSVAIIPHFSHELREYCKPFFPFDYGFDLRGTIYDRLLKAMRT